MSEVVSLNEGEQSCYGGTIVVIEVACLMEGEWSCYERWSASMEGEWFCYSQPEK